MRAREGELLASYEELYAEHQLFRTTCWPHSHQQFDLSAQCALISAGIWHDLNATSDFLSMCVKNVHENNLQLRYDPPETGIILPGNRDLIMQLSSRLLWSSWRTLSTS